MRGPSTKSLKAKAQREAYARAMAAMGEGHTCRAKTGEIGAAGECLRCHADQGVACREIRPTP